jgi:glycolate oxidase iron-sulfur subunit
MDYSVVQQCMHCGMCLPTCPTYDETLQERSSPRGRIAMMRAIADDRLEISKGFAEEMYFCLGCLACQTACPAGVDYATLFEQARAEIERVGVLDKPKRRAIRGLTLNRLFISKRRLRFLGRLLYIYQRSGLQTLVRRSGLLRLAPKSLRELEPLTPTAQRLDTEGVFKRVYQKQNPAQPTHRVALLSGCVQDIAFVDVNADTICALQANGCEVVLPRGQQCCGSLHAHNGEIAGALDLARRNIDAFKAESLDAIIINAGGCGSHMKHYDHLLADDPLYAERAVQWSAKVKDIHEFLDEINFRSPTCPPHPERVTYHESCHMKHGQQVSAAPRRILESIPGLDLVELTEADWCCGSAGIYNITQPEMSMKLLARKMGHIETTKARVVTAGNPGCTIQIEHGARRQGMAIEVVHPISLLAAAYRAEKETR